LVPTAVLNAACCTRGWRPAADATSVALHGYV
jgi:hypothetical protein